MEQYSKIVSFNFKDKKYNIRPSFRMVEEIEQEFGAIPNIINHIKNDDFKLVDTVTIMHIILSYLRVDIDYKDLGDEIIKTGANKFIAPVYSFLNIAFNGQLDR